MAVLMHCTTAASGGQKWQWHPFQGAWGLFAPGTWSGTEGRASVFGGCPVYWGEENERQQKIRLTEPGSSGRRMWIHLAI